MGGASAASTHEGGIPARKKIKVPRLTVQIPKATPMELSSPNSPGGSNWRRNGAPQPLTPMAVSNPHSPGGCFHRLYKNG